ncbi:MAG: site-specific DNA-methyltransferase [Candidatus Brocadiales bacterium]|nr:site-specific DNA-methyltransferase [Candidatus Brocadiales bacterium]
MQNLMNDLTKLFQKDERIFADGKLLKNKLTELALKLDQPLIELLLSDDKAKEHFFVEKTIKKDKVLVFDKDKFIAFVNNKEFLPDSFTSFKNKIGLMTNGEYLKEKGDVVLAWAYKDCVLEGGQDKEDQKRDEIFYNETLSPDEIDRLFEPKVLTNFKRYDSRGEHVVTGFNKDDNLIIKGNNLLALHCLKQKFRGRVKLIYIDPPYNTGNDSFNYNDKFNHSTWLTFMKNRLRVAMEILRNDGSIFIQIDDNEQAYLKVLCDEIFGRENFRNQISWLRSSSGKTISKNLANDIDYLLWYTKTDQYTFYPTYKPLSESTKAMYNKDDNDGRGKYRLFPLQKTGGPGPETTYDYVDNNRKVWKCPPKGWRMTKEKLKALENDGRLYFKGNALAEKAYWNERENEGKTANNLWDDIYNLQGSNSEYLDFAGQKPEALIERIIKTVTEENEIVVDFHVGSGTTCAVAHKMRRQYIGIEQLGYKKNDPVVRLKNVIKGDRSGISKDVKWKGGGSFVYAWLKEWNEQYISEIKEADTARKLLNIYEKMKREAFFRYDVDLSKFEEKEFEKLPLKEQKQVLCECLDKNHLYVNLSEIDDATYKVSAEDKKLNKEFYKTVV